MESGKAALAIPHFGLTFVYAPNSWKSSKRKIHPAPLWPRGLSLDSPTRPDTLSTDTNKSTVSGFNQLHKFNPPSMEKNKPQAPPRSPPPAGSTSHPALAPAYKPLLAVPALLPLPGEQPQLLLPYADIHKLNSLSLQLVPKGALQCHGDHRLWRCTTPTRLCADSPSGLTHRRSETCLPTSSLKADLTPWFLPLTEVWHKANADGTGEP